MLLDLDSCCAFGMAVDSGGAHQADGIRVCENIILDLLGPSMASGGEQHDVTADLSTFSSSKCA
eukprot:SAG11_NODE_1488_length_4814_cov_5.777943_4_plen_64_part_00